MTTITPTYRPVNVPDPTIGSDYMNDLETAVSFILTGSSRADDQGRSEFWDEDPKLRLVRNNVHDVLASPSPAFPYPFVSIAEAEVSFDEETEVKYGGMYGALLRFVDGDTLLYVHPRLRGKGIGNRLLRNVARMTVGQPRLWLPAHSEADRFTRSLGWQPRATTTSGGVLWHA